MNVDPLADSNTLEAGRGGVPRDRRGNALLIPRGMKIRVPYTSASSLSDYLADNFIIQRHNERLTAKGLAMREDLAALAGVNAWTPSRPGEESDDGNPAAGRDLDRIIERAKDVAGADVKADYGTVVHIATEPGNTGYVPERMRADVDSWWRAMRGIEIVATEIFVANDRLMAAGTFDHLVRIPGIDGLVVLDKKTGQMKPFEVEIQTSVYAYGEIYDKETGERQTFREAYGDDVNLDVGILAWLPATSGVTRLYRVDIDRGFENAQLAAQVRDRVKQGASLGKRINVEELARLRAAELVANATTREELSQIYREFEDIWTPELTSLGNAILTGEMTSA